MAKTIVLVANVKKIKEMEKFWGSEPTIHGITPPLILVRQSEGNDAFDRIFEIAKGSGFFHPYEINDSAEGVKEGDELWFSKDVSGTMVIDVFSVMGYMWPGKHTTTKHMIIGNFNSPVVVGNSGEGKTEIHIGNYSAKIPDSLLRMLSRIPRKPIKSAEDAESDHFLHGTPPIDRDPPGFVISPEDKELLDSVKTLMHLSGEVINTRKVDYTLVVEQNGYRTVLDKPEKLIRYANEKKEHVEHIRELLNRKATDLQSEIEKLK